MLLPALSGGPREREVAEFRSLLQTVFSCLKSVLYCMVAFHTNRGLQAPVRGRGGALCGAALPCGAGVGVQAACCEAGPAAHRRRGIGQRHLGSLALGPSTRAMQVLLRLPSLPAFTHPPTHLPAYAQLSFPVKMWSVRAGDVRAYRRLITFGLPALAFYEAMPHATVDMRDQFADFFTVLQVGGAELPHLSVALPHTLGTLFCLYPSEGAFCIPLSGPVVCQRIPTMVPLHSTERAFCIPLGAHVLHGSTARGPQLPAAAGCWGSWGTSVKRAAWVLSVN